MRHPVDKMLKDCGISRAAGDGEILHGFLSFKNTFWHSIRRLSFQLSGPVGSLYVAAAIGRSLRDNDARFDLGALALSTAILRRIWIPATSADERGATNVLP